jgi:hypothetical protein
MRDRTGELWSTQVAANRSKQGRCGRVNISIITCMVYTSEVVDQESSVGLGFAHCITCEHTIKSGLDSSLACHDARSIRRVVIHTGGVARSSSKQGGCGRDQLHYMHGLHKRSSRSGELCGVDLSRIVYTISMQRLPIALESGHGLENVPNSSVVLGEPWMLLQTNFH